MKSRLTPTKFVSIIGKWKYQEMIIPLTLLAITFAVNIIWKIDQTKYFALIGFIHYLFILRKYKINYPVLNESSDKEIISPISGEIVKVEKNSESIVLTIKTNLFYSSDFRTCEDNSEWKNNQLVAEHSIIEFENPLKKFDCNNFEKGKLVALNLKNKRIKMILKKIKLENIKKLKSGETTIGYIEE